MSPLRQIDGWPTRHAATALITRDGVQHTHGDVEHPFPWASVTKIATAVAVLVAVEEGIVSLDDPLGPEGSTVRHLLAHASGLPPEAGPKLAPPGARRIYSNAGFEELALHVERAAEMPFDAYFESVWGFGTGDSAAHGIVGTIDPLIEVAKELLTPTRLSPDTLAEATTVQFPGIAGVLPGFGRFTPNDWGLGFELRDGKDPHWMGRANSPSSFGHFGRSGTFLWVDPVAGIALACLTDLEFGDWAKDAWPRLSDAVLA